MNDRNLLRKAQIYITNEVVRICNLHGIHYFLDAGSMLGAVRHKGFIPWDDDMDIGMLKKDYEMFLYYAQTELNEDFFIDNYTTNDEYALVFTKVRLKNSLYLEEKGNQNLKHNEVFVDIFPYYYISDNEFVRKIEGSILAVLSQALMSKSGIKAWKGENKLKRIKFLPTDFLGMILTKEALHKWIDTLINRHSNTHRVCVHGGSCYNYWYFSRDIFDEYIDICFEGETYKIPKRFDDFLTIAYGDYMTLPPVERQITHRILALDLKNYVNKL